MAQFLFFLSAALTFLLFEFLALAEIIDLSSLLEIRSFGLGLRVDRTRIPFFRSLLVAMAIVAIVGIGLLIHFMIDRSIYDQTLIGSENVLLGIVVGPIFAIWINSIFRNSPNEGLSKGQTIAAIGLLLLTIIGVFGEQAGE